MTRSSRIRLGVIVLLAGAFVACAIDPLNPQPLPPGPPPTDDSPLPNFGGAMGSNNSSEDDGGAVVSAPTDAGTTLGADASVPATPDAGDDDAGADAGDAAIN